MEPAEVRRIAHLARLAIADGEIDHYARDLGAILELVEQMGRVDTSAIEPLAHPLDMAQRLRPDEITETDRRELYQRNAPQVDQGLYLVPKVID